MDQAEKLRQLKKNLGGYEEVRKTPRVITVSSGKVGVGKTNFVVNLAIALAQQEKRVVIFDADLGMANIDVLLGIIPKFNLYDVIEGHKELNEIVITGPYNIKIIPGGSGIQELANIDSYRRERLIKGLKTIDNTADVILIDTGAGIAKNVLGFAGAADEVVVVMTPEPTSLTDAYGFIKAVSKYKLHSKVYLVVNKVANPQEANHTITRMEKVVKRFLELQLDPLGYIFEDKVVNKSVMKQKPFVLEYPNSNASRSIKQIALNLIEGSYCPPRGTAGFMQRLIRLFG